MAIDLLGPASAPGAVTDRPSEVRTFLDIDTWFKPCSSPNNQDGTYLQAAFMNGLLAQFRYALRASGIDLDNADDAMLWKAILRAAPQLGLWHIGVAAGPTNALTADLSPDIAGYEDGLPIFVRFPSGVATGANIALDGLPAIPIQRNDGTPIQGPDIPAGSGALFNLFGTTALRLATFGAAEVLKIPALNKTFYVRPDGNDANDGLTNTSTGAVKTIDAALALTRSYFSSAGTITIKLGVAGTYDWPRTLSSIRNDITILGDVATPATYIISGAGPAGGGRGMIEANAGPVSLVGLNILNTSGINSHAAASGGGSLFLDRCIFSGSVPNNGAIVYAAGSSVVTFANAVTFGTPGANMIGVRNGQITFSSNTVITISGNPNYSDAVVSALDGGNVFFRAGCTRINNATGRKYYLAGNGIYRTAGLGTNFPPGNQDGFLEDVGSKYYP